MPVDVRVCALAPLRADWRITIWIAVTVLDCIRLSYSELKAMMVLDIRS